MVFSSLAAFFELLFMIVLSRREKSLQILSFPLYRTKQLKYYGSIRPEQNFTSPFNLNSFPSQCQSLTSMQGQSLLHLNTFFGSPMQYPISHAMTRHSEMNFTATLTSLSSVRNRFFLPNKFITYGQEFHAFFLIVM